MENCCSGLGYGSKGFNEKFDCEIEKTDKGVKMHIMPKDKSKVESFQKFVDASKDFCECDC